MPSVTVTWNMDTDTHTQTFKVKSVPKTFVGCQRKLKYLERDKLFGVKLKLRNKCLAFFQTTFDIFICNL